jgi:hypothetical protein
MSQGFTKGTPIDTDPTLSLNSDIVVPSQKAVKSYLAANYQPTLVSGTNIKSINGNSLLGSGDLVIGGGGLTVGTTPITSGVDGRVLFQSGGVVQQDSGFFWDNTNKRLGVGTTPDTSTRLDIRAQGTASTDIAFRVRNFGNTDNIISSYGNELTIIGRNQSTEPRLLINRAGSTKMLLGGTSDLNITFQSSGYGQINSGAQGLDIIASTGDIRTRNSSTFTLLKGNFFGIGQATPAARLDVRAQGALSTDIVFRVRNSADTADIFTANGDGTQNWLSAANNALSSIKAGTFNIIQYGNDNFGNVAVGHNSSNMIVPTTTYNTVLGANASSGASSTFAIGIGWGSIVNSTAGIVIGRTRVNGNYAIRIGYDGGASQYGGTNSIHLGRTTSGNDIAADNVFMTYFNSQSSSTLTRSNGSFGLLGQQSYIITNGTGALGTDTHMGNGGNTLVVRNHPSVPSTNVTDSFQQYSADIVAGNAAPHFRTENGNIIKLYQQSSAGILTVPQLVTVLQNLGLLS